MDNVTKARYIEQARQAEREAELANRAFVEAFDARFGIGAATDELNELYVQALASAREDGYAAGYVQGRILESRNQTGSRR